MEVGTTIAELGMTDSPHRPGTPEHAAWTHQRIRSEQLVRRVTGQSAVDTDRMKTLANADFTAAGYARPDPVDEILGIEQPRHVPFAIDASALIEGLRQLNAAVDATFKPLAEHLSGAFDKIVDAIKAGAAAQDQMAKLIDVVTMEWLPLPPQPGCAPGVEETRTLARKRHGIAAVCPRHGATKGGTCLTCARGRR